MENNIWKECKLGDCSNIITGFPFKSNEYEFKGELRVVRGENVTIGSLRWDSEKYWNKETELLQRYFLNEDDIVIGMDGSRVGQNRSLIKTYELPLILAQRVARIRAKQDVCQLYLWYNIYSNNFKEYIEAIHTGTSIPHISLKQIQDFEIQLPPLPEQKAIASVLSSLDDKIDLLHQQNQTLEALAETLFRQWFIEEAKEDWEEVKLGDLVDVFNGVSYKSDDLNPSTTAMVTLKSFERNGGFRMDGFKEYTGKYKETHLVEEGDLVVAHTDITQDAALIGNPVLVKSDPNYNKLIISMDLVKVVSKNSNFTNEFLYLLMKTREFKEHALGYSNGSTVLHLSKKAIPEFELKLPPNELVNSFTKRVSPLIKKQFVNQNQIQTLKQLRDTLLPKLMSGEVRVKL